GGRELGLERLSHGRRHTPTARVRPTRSARARRRVGAPRLVQRGRTRLRGAAISRLPGIVSGPSPGLVRPRMSSLDERAQLRTGALIALTAALLVFPVQAFAMPRAQLPVLLLVYAIHLAIATGILVATFTRFGARHADPLSVVFVTGLAANLLFYFYALPYAVPTYPSLMSSA